jgi:DNA-binding sugar fermentation-stimulating protein
MRFPVTLVPGVLVERSNRFIAEMAVYGVSFLAHLPNPGRMSEVMVPGQEERLRPVTDPIYRSTLYDLLMVKYQGDWEDIEAWQFELLTAIAPYPTMKRESKLGREQAGPVAGRPFGALLRGGQAREPG